MKLIELTHNWVRENGKEVVSLVKQKRPNGSDMAKSRGPTAHTATNHRHCSKGHCHHDNSSGALQNKDQKGLPWRQVGSSGMRRGNEGHLGTPTGPKSTVIFITRSIFITLLFFCRYSFRLLFQFLKKYTCTSNLLMLKPSNTTCLPCLTIWITQRFFTQISRILHLGFTLQTTHICIAFQCRTI